MLASSSDEESLSHLERARPAAAAVRPELPTAEDLGLILPRPLGMPNIVAVFPPSAVAVAVVDLVVDVIGRLPAPPRWFMLSVISGRSGRLLEVVSASSKSSTSLPVFPPAVAPACRRAVVGRGVKTLTPGVLPVLSEFKYWVRVGDLPATASSSAGEVPMRFNEDAPTVKFLVMSSTLNSPDRRVGAGTTGDESGESNKARLDFPCRTALGMFDWVDMVGGRGVAVATTRYVLSRAWW